MSLPPVLSYAHAVARLTPTLTLRMHVARATPQDDVDADDEQAVYHDFEDGLPAIVLPAVRPAETPTEVDDVRVSLTISDDSSMLVKPVSFLLPKVDTAPVEHSVELTFEDSALLQAMEESRSTLTLTLESGGDSRSESVPGPRVLSSRQWILAGDDHFAAASLATFVQPQHPEIARLAKEASAVLAERTGSSALDGYAGAPGRVDATVEAVCTAFHDRGISYALPPTNWGEVGQRVRTAEEVLDGGLATCLDSTLVLASTLEYLGIEPLVIVLDGHCLLGYRKSDDHESESLSMSGWRIVNQIDRSAIEVLETTLLTAEQEPSAASLRREAHHGIGEGGSKIRFVLSVHEARTMGILPQKARARDDDGNIVEVAAPVTVRANVVTLGENIERVVRPARLRERAPERVEKWKADLLDLSLRNRLINCAPSAVSSHKVIELAIPEAILGSFEDIISSGTEIKLIAAGERAAVARRVGRGFNMELEPPQLAPLLADHKEVQVDLSDEVYDSTLRKLRTSARTLIDETGANNLYLALGTLVWETKGKEVRSPLVFVPVELLRVSKNSPYKLRLDSSGSSTPNYSLIERLRTDLGLRMPELSDPAADDAGLDIPLLFDTVRKTLSENRLPFRVEATTYLGIFQFGTFRLWRDLEESWRLFARNPLVRHLIEAPGEVFEDPAASNPIPDLEEVLRTLPTPADASQIDVVANSAAGRTMVVEGPPGTGKSQTITNLIIRAIADGKKVMFVAEKRAALDVVAKRLKRAGVGDLVLNLHDRTMRPDDIRGALLRAADHTVRPDTTALAVHSGLAEKEQSALGRYRSTLHSKAPSGFSLYTARSTLIAYGDSVPALPLKPSEIERLDPACLDTLKRSALVDLADLQLRLPAGAGRAYSFLTRPVPPAQAERLFAVIEDVQNLPEIGLRADLVTSIAACEPADRERIACALESSQFSWQTLRRAHEPEWGHACELLEEALQECEAQPVIALDHFSSSVLDEDLVAVRDALVNAKNAFFGKTRKSERALGPLAAHRLALPLPERPAELLAIVDNLLALQRHRRNLRDLLPAVLPEEVVGPMNRWSPFEATGIARAREAVAWIRSMASIVPAPGVRPNALQQLAEELLSSADRVSTAGLVRRCADVAAAAADTGALEGVPLVEVLDARRPSDSQEERKEDFRARLALLDAVEPFRAAGLVTTADALLDGQARADDLRSAFECGLAMATVEARATAGALRGFSASLQNDSTERLSTELARLQDLLPDSVVSRAIDARSFGSDKPLNPRFAKLRSDLERKRRKRPIRDLISEYGDLITELTPCVLVSPDSVARFFPAERQDFDLVVFDEASQITVASAIGAMGRGRAIVICGDSKQMPPTSFAELTRDEDDDSVPVDEESILSECVAAHVPRKQLTWHYRSQDESLIAFSNARYYEGKLSSFPSPLSGTSAKPPEGYGISLRRVEGEFLRSIPRGRSRRFFRTNPIEADAIVAEIRSRFARTENPSIGVVTFNIQQRDLIEQKLRDLDDHRVTVSLDSDDGLFVKNLENVQGDERDTIFFSVAFSAGENGQVPLNFGPLNRSGGERRLNVAITRARKEVVLFASFAPAALHVERSQSEGLRDLRAYLELAEVGACAPSAIRGRGSMPDSHRDEIAAALRQAGLVVSTDVGLSEFRLDLVLARAETPEEPTVAVMLDGAGWSLRRTAYDRDVLPAKVLKHSMHWPRVERIWMPEWLADPRAVTDKLVRLVNAGSPVAAAEADASSPGGGESHHRTAPTSSKILPPPPDRHALSSGQIASMAIGGETLTGTPAPSSPRGVEHRHAEAEERVLTRPSPFVGANEVPGGDRATLDDAVVDSRARAKVVNVAGQILAIEFPVEQRRFHALIARAFGLARMKHARQEQIAQILRGGPWRTDEYGFVWPADVPPTSLRSYRIDILDHLQLEEVHPQELDNAVRDILGTRRTTGLGHVDKVRAVFEGLGTRNRRLTSAVRERIEESIRRVTEEAGR
ncbi:DUF4011 domain-containing protein [Schaalia sp. 19OD2882]|uniref:DUF4011 domain-containing protein n=1 Tax=Schaalia sp. 19OD2882 TaxID=2794089 RepID=UPI001C1E9EE8|nr:DUF4011 domain-containing protein [Schaalia sp. 19OD2882]QWW19011.1 DUF4011 domain-containing protein [Schaalia sp. 19OD2882]